MRLYLLGLFLSLNFLSLAIAGTVDPTAARYVQVSKDANGCKVLPVDSSTVLFIAGTPVPAGAVRAIPVTCAGDCKKPGDGPDSEDILVHCVIKNKGAGVICEGCDKCDATVGRVIERESSIMNK